MKTQPAPVEATTPPTAVEVATQVVHDLSSGKIQSEPNPRRKTPVVLVDEKGAQIMSLNDVKNPLALPEGLRWVYLYDRDPDNPLPVSEYKKALAEFQKTHGARVRRADAMAILNIDSVKVFQKVVEANPDLRHRIPGEDQDRYVTALLWLLLPAASRSAA